MPTRAGTFLSRLGIGCGNFERTFRRYSPSLIGSWTCSKRRTILVRSLDRSLPLGQTSRAGRTRAFPTLAPGIPSGSRLVLLGA